MKVKGTYRSDAQIELQKRCETYMRETKRWVFSEAREKILDLDPVLERRLNEEKKGNTPR